jgi:hypothetical protein
MGNPYGALFMNSQVICKIARLYQSGLSRFIIVQVASVLEKGIVLDRHGQLPLFARILIRGCPTRHPRGVSGSPAGSSALAVVTTSVCS